MAMMDPGLRPAGMTAWGNDCRKHLANPRITQFAPEFQGYSLKLRLIIKHFALTFSLETIALLPGSLGAA